MGGFKTVVKMVEGLMEDYNMTVPVAIHLDHGSSFEKCKEAIDAGFTSVMIDASHPFDENIEITSKVVEYAHSKGVSVEANWEQLAARKMMLLLMALFMQSEECEELVNVQALIACTCIRFSSRSLQRRTKLWI